MHKNLPKILKITFISVFILQMICLIFILSIPLEGQALTFEPQVPLPGVGKTEINSGSTSLISQYIRAIYIYAIGIVGIVATVVMMFGGILWIVAGGNASKIGEAKAWIVSSITGLLLALSSYMILYTVNPELVNIKMGALQQGTVSTARGCCPGPPTCVNSLEGESKNGFKPGWRCDTTTKQCISPEEEKAQYTTGCCGVTWGETITIEGSSNVVWHPRYYSNKSQTECDALLNDQINALKTAYATTHPADPNFTNFNVQINNELILGETCP